MITLSNGQNLPSQKLRTDEMRERKVSSMRFSERLNEWRELADCTAKELSEACGLSAATLSRFRPGNVLPIRRVLSSCFRAFAPSPHVRKAAFAGLALCAVHRLHGSAAVRPGDTAYKDQPASDRSAYFFGGAGEGYFL